MQLLQKQSTLEDEEKSFAPLNIKRSNVEYVDTSQRFYEVSRDFSKQYAHIYSSRLRTFRNILQKCIENKWGKKYQILKLCDLREGDDLCIIVGTLFKHQQLKPSILKELSDQLEILPQPARSHFVHEKDSLILEDELQRIRLEGDCIDVHNVVTGVVCAILGCENVDGVFSMKEVCWPDCNIQKPVPQLADDRYIVLASGLNISSMSGDHIFPLHLLCEWIAGCCGDTDAQEEISKIVRVIFAGGTFVSNEYKNKTSESDLLAAAEKVDKMCAALCSVTELDIMPGSNDPTGVMIPQKPFHYCLFPKAAEYKSFHRVSNPYECSIEGNTFLGTSGESIHDIMSYSNISSEIEAMMATLCWRHLAPTAPDTLPCAPCIDTDPMIIYNCPSVYFMGGAKCFDTQMYNGGDFQKVRMICVPDFSSSQSVAVINIRTLECNTVTFS